VLFFFRTPVYSGVEPSQTLNNGSSGHYTQLRWKMQAWAILRPGAAIGDHTVQPAPACLPSLCVCDRTMKALGTPGGERERARATAGRPYVGTARGLGLTVLTLTV
jgi:hypothetical protein